MNRTPTYLTLGQAEEASTPVRVVDAPVPHPIFWIGSIAAMISLCYIVFGMKKR